jgi:hypothetical protein
VNLFTGEASVLWMRVICGRGEICLLRICRRGVRVFPCELTEQHGTTAMFCLVHTVLYTNERVVNVHSTCMYFLKVRALSLVNLPQKKRKRKKPLQRIYLQVVYTI